MGEMADWAYDQALKEMEMDGHAEVVGVTFDEVKHETDMAILFEIDGEEQWVPKSIITNSSYESDGEITIPLWFAKQEELI